MARVRFLGYDAPMMIGQHKDNHEDLQKVRTEFGSLVTTYQKALNELPGSDLIQSTLSKSAFWKSGIGRFIVRHSAPGSLVQHLAEAHIHAQLGIISKVFQWFDRMNLGAAGTPIFKDERKEIEDWQNGLQRPWTLSRVLKISIPGFVAAAISYFWRRFVPADLLTKLPAPHDFRDPFIALLIVTMLFFFVFVPLSELSRISSLPAFIRKRLIFLKHSVYEQENQLFDAIAKGGAKAKKKREFPVDIFFYALISLTIIGAISSVLLVFEQFELSENKSTLSLVQTEARYPDLVAKYPELEAKAKHPVLHKVFRAHIWVPIADAPLVIWVVGRSLLTYFARRKYN
jgi:hypothetical protein